MAANYQQPRQPLLIAARETNQTNKTSRTRHNNDNANINTIISTPREQKNINIPLTQQQHSLATMTNTIVSPISPIDSIVVEKKPIQNIKTFNKYQQQQKNKQQTPPPFNIDELLNTCDGTNQTPEEEDAFKS